VTNTPDTTLPAIEVSGVSLAFSGLRVLNDMNMELREGEILGLIGPNGCGKTTLLNCINRIYQSERGTIRYFGQSLDHSRADQVASLGVARTFQATTVFRDITALDMVLIGRHVRISSGFWSSLAGLPLMNGDQRRQKERALKFIDFVGLRDVAAYEVGELSYATAKLLDLARALAAEPRVLLLDEPASGLSRSARLWMSDLLPRIRTELGVTLLIIEHDMALVSRVCDRVVVMNEGSSFATGDPHAVLADPAVVGSLMGMTVAPEIPPEEGRGS
jgi:ABC-type branched-subunit amino acid transport system ATPase component